MRMILFSFIGVGLPVSLVVAASWLHNEQRHLHNVAYSLSSHVKFSKEMNEEILVLEPMEDPDLHCCQKELHFNPRVQFVEVPKELQLPE